MISWGVDSAHPVDASLAVGILYSGGTLAGAGLGEVYTYVSKGKNSD